MAELKLVPQQEQDDAGGRNLSNNGPCWGQSRICSEQVLRRGSIAVVTSAPAGEIYAKISLVWELPPRWLKEENNVTIYVEPGVRKELVQESPFYSFLQTWEKDEDVYSQYLHKKIDIVITLGGDGTMLWAATLFKGPIPPIVAFSMGSLGFITSIRSDRYKECVHAVMECPVYVTLQHRLHCQIISNNKDEDGAQENPVTTDHLVLNEVAIDRGMSSFLTSLEVLLCQRVCHTCPRRWSDLVNAF